VLETIFTGLFSRPTAKAPEKPVGIPNPGVRIVDGKIIPQYACQAEIVGHCNLSCRDCNHLSPIAGKGYADPERLYQDFSILAKVYQPQLVYLAGGEPLLNPRITEAVRAVRASGISDRMRILTNGVLLPRMKDEFWESIDDLEISVYPGFEIEAKLIETYKRKAREFNVRLELYYYSEFRRTFSITGTQDSALVKRIYGACKAAHIWGCHYLHNGYVYKCPQSAFLPRMLGLTGEAATRDGIKLRDAPEFRNELYAYLTSPEPLQGCNHCLATTGVQRPHTQVRPREWVSDQEGEMESMVDYEELARIEAEMHIQKPDHIKELIESTR
jgi:sulfatase maturation enzyme AslB (radical SAM superfamily)